MLSMDSGEEDRSARRCVLVLIHVDAVHDKTASVRGPTII